MADNPIEFVKSFEKKFKTHMDKPRMEFLVHFRPREFHYYILIIAEIQANYRKKAPFDLMIRKFPMSHWHESALELLKRFNKKREPSPEDSGIENGMSILKSICREFPEFFADHLDQLFIARIDFPGHLTTYMWQQFGMGYQDFLQLYVDTNGDDFGEQCRGLSFALITGIDKMERWAKDYIRNKLDIPNKKVGGVNLAQAMLNEYLQNQGLEWRGNDLHRLYPEYAYHITFAYRYLHVDMNHDTFKKLDPLQGSFTFGGAMNAVNAEGRRTQVQHLICLDPIPKFLGIRGLHRLMIACDMDIVLHTAGATYQQHKPNGSVTILGDNRTNLPGGPHYKQKTPYIKSTKVVLSNQGPAWYFQRYGKAENYYRLGGPPTFIRGAYYPECCGCGRTMRFIMELDSHLPRTDDQPMEWGVDGMAYIYWCDNCSISAIHWFTD
ncbi:MAG: hypothetical protein AAF570_02605 [Bacteroidota bacterium]